MPPRIRTRASKALKENIDVSVNKLKSVKSNTNTKAPRKVLADKTNSASDDASLEIPTKSIKTVTKGSKTGLKTNVTKKQNAVTKQNQNLNAKQISQQKENIDSQNEARPRRDRRLPTRFVDNHVLNNFLNSEGNSNTILNKSTPKADNNPANNESVLKSDKSEPSPFKTPAKTADSSLVVSRQRRICRLPSRFEDHSLSPRKYIPIPPANASTPIQQSKTKPLTHVNDTHINNKVGKDEEQKQATIRPTRLAKMGALQKESSDNSSEKSSPDSNNNAKGRSTTKKATKTQQPINKNQSPVQKNLSPIRQFLTPITKKQIAGNKMKSPVNKKTSPVKKVSPEKSKNNKKTTDKNVSFKLLGSKKTSEESENKGLDIYEFTFDPDEEPQPQKKKRKRTVTKKPSTKPKKVVYKSSYDQNISKALAALKNAVNPRNTAETPKLTQIEETSKLTQIAETSDEGVETVEQNNVTNNRNKSQNTNVNNANNMVLNDTGKTSVHEGNYPSIRIEDIAADIEPSMEHHDDINYSPVNSPRSNVGSPNAHDNLKEYPERSTQNNDPLNLQEELSFFDEQPVASSSMNMSTRHPLASPWRVEFGSLPIKWPVNTYVKANMTPAVECSFISSEDTFKKKHVYTNLLPQTDEMFTGAENNTYNLKQPSIMSFMREMAEKSARKKRGRSVSPAKAIFTDIVDTNGDTNKNKKSTKKGHVEDFTPVNTSEEVSDSVNNTDDKENSKEERKTRKRKNDGNICDLPAKSPRQQKDKDCTLFGFDESENEDTENVSPVKINKNHKGRSLRPRTRVVLQEINGPTRAEFPVAAKTKIATSSEAVNRVYEELKSAADAPLFPENNVENNVTNVEDPILNEDSQSVHLFEDIEVLHHLKPSRKSYGKAKKVTFRQRSTSDSDSLEVAAQAKQNESSDYDDLGDLSFEIPNVQEKKTTKKKKPKKKLRNKKEEQEAEAWAANFNSMCEDIEEFPLIVE